MSNFPDLNSHNYQIIRELGRNREGGRITYLASQLDSDQLVVIKQFRFLQESASWQGFKAYQREIEILQDLNHPRIPQYRESFDTPDGFCLVQEYKNAPTLASKQSLTPEAIKSIAISILEILADLQNQIPPVIHRDIKPENILIDEENKAYLIDFGLARLKSDDIALSSIAAGTPGFMAPEEMFNRPLSAASDLYSVGATLIGLLTRTPSVNLSHLIDENYRFKFRHLVTDLNPRFITWLTKMVEPNVKDRYGSADEALSALKPLELLGSSTDAPRQTKQLSLLQLSMLSGITLVSFGLALRIPSRVSVPSISEQPLTAQSQSQTQIDSGATSAEQWFNKIKPSCNTLEVVTAIRSSPPPDGFQGAGYGAGCYALAGKIDKADSLIRGLPKNERGSATGILFNIGHPVADAGDDESAGPIMELVLKYWPENYMALYHAGMSNYALGNTDRTEQQLKLFLQLYQNNDGWRQNALTVLKQIERGIKTGNYPKDP
jgi:serine/threonine protein kinase